MLFSKNSLSTFWLLERECLRLSKRKSFARVDPDAVASMLHQLADTQEVFDPSRLTRLQGCLLSIWNNAKEEFDKKTGLHFKWHRVMATCNALYDQLALAEEITTAEADLAYAHNEEDFRSAQAEGER